MRLTPLTKINFIAAYYFITGGLLLLLAIAAIVTPLGAVAFDASAFLARLPGWFLGLSIAGVAGGLAALGAANLVIGWGLWQLKPWGRLWAMIVGVLQIPLVPLGTLAGGASLYVLLQDQTRDLFLG